MQPCNRIYYSNVYWRLNMFRAAYRSSSGTPNCICSLWFIIPMFIEGSTCFERHTAHHQELQTVFAASGLLFQCLLKAQHVSSGIPLIIRNSKLYLQPLVYYSNVYWRLNMFRAAYRSSSGTPNCICSLWFIHTCGDRPLSSLSGFSDLTTAGHHICI